jgi:DNA-binding CsgD family transcriptional regulator
MQPEKKHLAGSDLERVIDYLGELNADLMLTSFAHRVVSGLPALIDADMVTYQEVNGERRLRRFECYPPAIVSTPEAAPLVQALMDHPLFADDSWPTISGVYRLSDLLRTEQFRAPPVYKEVLAHLGIEYQLMASLAMSPACLIVIALHRRSCDFSERDRLVLEALRPHIIQAYRSAQLIERTGHDLNTLRQVMVGRDRAVIVLDARGKIKWWTKRAREWVRVYCNAIFVESSDQLPECFDRWYQQQLSLESATDSMPAPGDPLIVERPGSRLIVYFIPDHLHDEHILLLELNRTESSPACLAGLGLSPRECEALFWVAKGKTNCQVGTILHLSTRTVEKHLEHIYIKLGVETRTAAALRAQALLGESTIGLEV